MCTDELDRDYPTANMILAGDLNQLSDHELIERTGLAQIVTQPTRGNVIRDRVFVSYSQLSIWRSQSRGIHYKSDHKASVAHPDASQCAQPQSELQKTYRRKTPKYVTCTVSSELSNHQLSLRRLHQQHQCLRPNTAELWFTLEGPMGSSWPLFIFSAHNSTP